MDITSSPEWNELRKDSVIEDKNTYQEILAVFYAEFGQKMLETGVIHAFIDSFELDRRFNITFEKVQRDLIKIELIIKKAENVTDIEAYKKLLHSYYNRYKKEDKIFNKVRIEALIDIYQLETQLHICYKDVWNDLMKIKFTGKIENVTDMESYESLLYLFYNENKDHNSTFNNRMIQELIESFQLDTQLHKYYCDVWNDLAKMHFEDEIGVITDRQSYLESLEIYYNEFEDDILFDEEILSKFISTYHLDTRFNISLNDVWNDFAKIKRQSKLEDKIIEKFEDIEDEETYKEALELYYNVFGEDMFELDKVQRFIDTFDLEEIDITPNTVYRDLRAIKREFETGNIVSSKKAEPLQTNIKFNETKISQVKTPIKQKQTVNNIPPLQTQVKQKQTINNAPSVKTPIKQTQTVNNIPPLQTQSKQIQTINNNVPRKPETLDEYMLIDIVRNMPLWLNSESFNISEYSLVIEMCTRIVKETIPGIMAGQTLMQYEDIIRQKRLRTSNKAEYDRQIENDIFYELFCYSYLINVFQAVTGKLAPDKLDMILNVDLKNYISLVENECKKRVQNLESEKKHIHSIEVISKKYAQISTQYKMPTLGFINQRENDFIIASLMRRGMISCIAPFFGDDKVEWQFLYIIPAQEFAQTLDIYFSQAISMRLSLYTGDKLFKDLTF